MHPDDRKEIEAAFEQIMRGTERSLQKEFRVNRKDGGWVWIETPGTNHIDNPAIHGIGLHISNITGSKEGQRGAAGEQVPVHFLSRFLNSG